MKNRYKSVHFLVIAGLLLSNVGWVSAKITIKEFAKKMDFVHYAEKKHDKALKAYDKCVVNVCQKERAIVKEAREKFGGHWPPRYRTPEARILAREVDNYQKKFEGCLLRECAKEHEELRKANKQMAAATMGFIFLIVGSAAASIIGTGLGGFGAAKVAERTQANKIIRAYENKGAIFTKGEKDLLSQLIRWESKFSKNQAIKAFQASNPTPSNYFLQAAAEIYYGRSDKLLDFVEGFEFKM